MPHRGQEDSGEGLAAPDFAAFMRHFCHPDGIKGRIKIIQSSGVRIELVARNGDEVSHGGST